jgi:hypothetical protein
VVVNTAPQIVLVARTFEGRTRSALDFLRENGLPVRLIPVAVYQDASGRRFIDVEADQESAVVVRSAGGGTRSGASTPVMYQGRRAQVADLINAGLLEPGVRLEFPRPRRNEMFCSTVLADGSIQTEDGQVWGSPSRAAMHAANIPSYDGWHAWRVPSLGGITLDRLRQQLITEVAEPASAGSADDA